MSEKGLPDFSGKVVFVQLLNGQNWDLTEPEFERQGNGWMLVGKPSYGEDHWTQGTIIGVRWRYVAYYVVFNSIEEYQARRTENTEAAKAPEPPRLGWLTRHLIRTTPIKDA